MAEIEKADNSDVEDVNTKEANKELNSTDDTFYFVDASLRNRFIQPTTSFSLLKKFGGDKRKKSSIQNADRIEEGEEVSIKYVVKNEFSDHTAWWKNEILFFKPDDENLKDGVNFILESNNESLVDLKKLRSDLKEVVHHKLRKCNNRKQMIGQLKHGGARRSRGRHRN